MKKIKKFLILIPFLLIVSMQCSAQKLNVTLKTPLDSVIVAKKHMIAATNAMIELRFYKKIDGLCQNELHSKDIEIAHWKQSSDMNKFAIEKYDSIQKLYVQMDDKSQVQMLKLRQEIKRLKIKSTLTTIGIPVIGGFCFGVGLLVGHFIN